MSESSEVHTWEEMHVCSALYHLCGFARVRLGFSLMCSHLWETRAKCSLVRWHVCVFVIAVCYTCVCTRC